MVYITMQWIIFWFKRLSLFDYFIQLLQWIRRKYFMSNKNNQSIFDKIFIFSFFRGDGQFQPLYFFVFVFSMLAIVLVGLKIYIVWLNIKQGNISIDLISSTDIATLVTFVGGILTIYNYNKKNKLQYLKKPQQEEDSKL